MLEQYGVLALVVFLSFLLFAMLLLAGSLFGRRAAWFQKFLPSSMIPKSNEPAPAWRRYHAHYYIFALLFLAFDMEMAFMYPWAVVFKELGLEAFADMGIFLTILFLGLLFAWSQRGLERQ